MPSVLVVLRAGGPEVSPVMATSGDGVVKTAKASAAAGSGQTTEAAPTGEWPGALAPAPARSVVGGAGGDGLAVAALPGRPKASIDDPSIAGFGRQLHPMDCSCSECGGGDARQRRAVLARVGTAAAEGDWRKTVQQYGLAEAEALARG